MRDLNLGSINGRQLCLRFFAPLALAEWRSVGGFSFSWRRFLTPSRLLRTTFTRSNWRFWAHRCNWATHRCWCSTGSLCDGNVTIAGFGVTWFYSHFTGETPCPCDVVSTEVEIKEMAKVDLGGVMAISPERYGEYLDELVEQYELPRDRVSELVAESLREIPACHDW
jgi:hypothetical protein